MRKTISTVLIIAITASTAFAIEAGLSDVLGRGRSTVFKGLGAIVQIMDAPAKNLFEALEVNPVQENDALGTITKKGESVACTYLSKNERQSGFYTYSCTIELSLKGKVRQ